MAECLDLTRGGQVRSIVKSPRSKGRNKQGNRGFAFDAKGCVLPHETRIDFEGRNSS